MKTISIIAAAFLSLMAFPAFATDSKLMDAISAAPQLNENCSASLIYSDRDKKSGDAKTLLLTAKHCVVDDQDGDQFVDFFVYEKNRVVKKDRYIASVKGVSYKVDLALIELKDKKTVFDKVNKLAGKDVVLTMGDPTVAIGYPFSMGLTFTEGNFLSIIKVPNFDAKNEFLRATPDIGPGNSGGALLKKNADGSYEQIGVTTAVIPGWPFTGLFTGIEDIRAYLHVAAPEAIGEVVTPVVASPAGR